MSVDILTSRDRKSKTVVTNATSLPGKMKDALTYPFRKVSDRGIIGTSKDIVTGGGGIARRILLGKQPDAYTDSVTVANASRLEIGDFVAGLHESNIPTTDKKGNLIPDRDRERIKPNVERLFPRLLEFWKNETKALIRLYNDRPDIFSDKDSFFYTEWLIVSKFIDGNEFSETKLKSYFDNNPDAYNMSMIYVQQEALRQEMAAGIMTINTDHEKPDSSLSTRNTHSNAKRTRIYNVLRSMGWATAAAGSGFPDTSLNIGVNIVTKLAEVINYMPTGVTAIPAASPTLVAILSAAGVAYFGGKAVVSGIDAWKGKGIGIDELQKECESALKAIQNTSEAVYVKARYGVDVSKLKFDSTKGIISEAGDYSTGHDMLKIDTQSLHEIMRIFEEDVAHLSPRQLAFSPLEFLLDSDGKMQAEIRVDQSGLIYMQKVMQEFERMGATKNEDGTFLTREATVSRLKKAHEQVLRGYASIIAKDIIASDRSTEMSGDRTRITQRKADYQRATGDQEEGRLRQQAKESLDKEKTALTALNEGVKDKDTGSIVSGMEGLSSVGTFITQENGENTFASEIEKIIPKKQEIIALFEEANEPELQITVTVPDIESLDESAITTLISTIDATIDRTDEPSKKDTDIAVLYGLKDRDGNPIPPKQPHLLVDLPKGKLAAFALVAKTYYFNFASNAEAKKIVGYDKSGKPKYDYVADETTRAAGKKLWEDAEGVLKKAQELRKKLAGKLVDLRKQTEAIRTHTVVESVKAQDNFSVPFGEIETKAVGGGKAFADKNSLINHLSGYPNISFTSGGNTYTGIEAIMHQIQSDMGWSATDIQKHENRMIVVKAVVWSKHQKNLESIGTTYSAEKTEFDKLSALSPTTTSWEAVTMTIAELRKIAATSFTSDDEAKMARSYAERINSSIQKAWTGAQEANTSQVTEIDKRRKKVDEEMDQKLELVTAAENMTSTEKAGKVSSVVATYRIKARYQDESGGLQVKERTGLTNREVLNKFLEITRGGSGLSNLTPEDESLFDTYELNVLRGGPRASVGMLRMVDALFAYKSATNPEKELINIIDMLGRLDSSGTLSAANTLANIILDSSPELQRSVKDINFILTGDPAKSVAPLDTSKYNYLDVVFEAIYARHTGTSRIPDLEPYYVKPATARPYSASEMSRLMENVFDRFTNLVANKGIS